MGSESKTTTDLKEIRAWAEARGGKPVSVKGTGGKNDPGLLRIDFPGGAGDDRFEALTWGQLPRPQGAGLAPTPEGVMP
jgi:hypothetical protein